MNVRTTLRAIPGLRGLYAAAGETLRHPLALRRLPRYLAERRSYVAMGGEAPLRLLRPYLADAGRHPFDPHYVHQAGWATRRVAAAQPVRHVDVGGELGWLAALAAIVPVEFIDVRPLAAAIPGITSRSGSVLELPYADCTLESVSCLHVVEHVGLGRYGDALDPDGTRRALAELARVTAGQLFISLPIGRQRTEFNAQRVVPASAVPAMVPLALVEFSYVDDDGELHEHAAPADAARLEYGCGLFTFHR